MIKSSIPETTIYKIKPFHPYKPPARGLVSKNNVYIFSIDRPDVDVVLVDKLLEALVAGPVLMLQHLYQLVLAPSNILVE